MGDFMPSFNDYVNQSGNDSSNASSKNKAMEMLKGWASKYEGMSETDLVKAIVKEAEKNRAEGKLTDADLDSFKSMLMPFLNSSQAKRLEKIIEKLKNQ